MGFNTFLLGLKSISPMKFGESIKSKGYHINRKLRTYEWTGKQTESKMKCYMDKWLGQ